MAWWGLMRRRWLASPVISVGSVSAGGAGKTPVVLLLARILTRRGYAVRILTRGYGRRSSGVERVLEEGDARWFGDEPVLMAQRSGVPVFVGADRYEAGLLAEKSVEAGKVMVHLLDDGFQHVRLGREIDVVLLTREDLEDSLLPGGNLRESLTALRYADVVVLREEELAWTEPAVARLRQPGRSQLVAVIRRRLGFGEGGPKTVAERVLAFCGIARPEGFVASLAVEGIVPVETMFFADHHGYGEEDMERLVERATAAGATGFVTTEKDAVKLTGGMRERLETVGPVVVARLVLELVDEKLVMDRMISRVRMMERRRKKQSLGHSGSQG
jgi:tetraacyldisaccharide 4'-kinase